MTMEGSVGSWIAFWDGKRIVMENQGKFKQDLEIT